jgi:hypothetical protein
VSRILLLGAVLVVTMTLLADRLWGSQAAMAAAAFGALAIAIQAGAFALMKPARHDKVEKFLRAWGAGMGLRLAGVVAIAVAAGLDPGHFPPLAAALGFLGVLLPLLFYEVRLIR